MNQPEQSATPVFYIETTMQKTDYRKFLYFVTFLRNKIILPAIAVMALLGSVISNSPKPFAHPVAVFLTWLFMFALAVAAVALKVEQTNNRRIATDNTGTFDSVNILSFYDDRLVMQNPSVKATGELEYTRFHLLVETRNYFMFYHNANQASLLRKKDIAEPQAFGEFIRLKFSGKYKDYRKWF